MVTTDLTYTPASQIATRSLSNSAYVWDLYVDQTDSYTANNLNQYSAIGAASVTYDTNGNLTGDPGAATGAGSGSTFAYDAENRLKAMSALGAKRTVGYRSKADIQFKFVHRLLIGRKANVPLLAHRLSETTPGAKTRGVGMKGWFSSALIEPTIRARSLSSWLNWASQPEIGSG